MFPDPRKYHGEYENKTQVVLNMKWVFNTVKLQCSDTTPRFPAYQMCTVMSTDEAVMEAYSSSLYTGLKSHLAKHSPTAANMAAETPSAAEGQL